MAFDIVTNRLRYMRNRLPPQADLRDSNQVELIDKFFFVSKPTFVVDFDSGETNADRTLSCIVTTSSGPRAAGCPGGVSHDLPVKITPAPPTQPYWLPASPSGYVVKSYPILRNDAAGALQALYPERVVVETRNVGNSRVGTESKNNCNNTNAILQETYYFTGASPNQVLVATFGAYDVSLQNDVFAINQTDPDLFAATQPRSYGPQYIITLDIEVATGPWAEATDVWIRHFNTGNLPTDPALPTDTVREVYVYKARSSRRPLPGTIF
jgi:hypothetical protein